MPDPTKRQKMHDKDYLRDIQPSMNPSLIGGQGECGPNINRCYRIRTRVTPYLIKTHYQQRLSRKSHFFSALFHNSGFIFITIFITIEGLVKPSTFVVSSTEIRFPMHSCLARCDACSSCCGALNPFPTFADYAPPIQNHPSRVETT